MRVAWMARGRAARVRPGAARPAVRRAELLPTAHRSRRSLVGSEGGFIYVEAAQPLAEPPAGLRAAHRAPARWARCTAHSCCGASTERRLALPGRSRSRTRRERAVTMSHASADRRLSRHLRPDDARPRRPDAPRQPAVRPADPGGGGRPPQAHDVHDRRAARHRQGARRAVSQRRGDGVSRPAARLRRRATAARWWCAGCAR